MKKNLKKILIFSLLLVLLSGKNKNMAFSSFNLNDNEFEKLAPDSLLTQQFNRALEFYKNSDFQYAEQSFLNAVNTINTGNVTDQNMIYRTYVNFGVLKGRLGKRSEAMEFYSLAEKFTIENYGEQSVKLVPIYVNIGSILSDLDDLFKAQNYYEKALILIGDSESRFLSQTHNNLGNIYYKRMQYDLALQAYMKSLNIKEKSNYGNISTTLNGIANCYKKLGQFVKAEEYYIKSIDNIKSVGGENHYLLGDLYINYAIFQANIDKSNVLKYLNLASKIYHSNYDFHHPDIAYCFLNFGEYYGDIKQYSQSLNYYQKAILSEIENFKDSSIYINPSLNEIEPQISILKILKGKANVLSKLYLESNTISDLDFSLQTYDLCLDIIDKIRIGYQDEESKLFLSQNEKDTYTVAIEIAVKLYDLTKEFKYKEKAFRYAERSKAASLMSALNDVNAKNFGGIPADLQDEELQLRKDIAGYREKVYEERRKAQPDKDKIAEWQGQLFELNEKYNKMVLRFENEYPEYYALKYSNKTIEISDLQSKLNSNEALLEYSISDSSLFTFIVTRDSFEINRQDINDLNLDYHIENVRSSLKTNEFAENSSDYYKSFCKSSYQLYQTFIAPNQQKINNKKLIIIPDGKMAYVPFGVLIKDQADLDRMSYRDLNYLIKSNPVTYQNSATIGYSIKSAGISILSSKSVLAFAPSYQGVSDSILYTQRAYRDKLYPLMYTKEEVNNISTVMKGDLFVDDLATEQNFKANAGKYDVLHLAMHTIIDDENPMYSKLVFTQTDDSLQDGLLNTHEIYNMNFNARMVVLSACNTDDGKLLKGEGVMSLARGFFYAGCPSIIMTLWTVEDQSGSNLMTYFYQFLSQGLNKDEALRSAKLKYLDQADPLKSHPYFWSGYVTMGDIEPLYDIKLKNNLIYAGLGLLVLVLFILIRKSLKRKRLALV